MNTQSVSKNLTLIDTLGQMGFRLCLMGLLGFLGSLFAQQVLGHDFSSSSVVFQLLISCWGFVAAGGMMYVGSQFVVGPYRKKMKVWDESKDIAFQLAKLGGRYRVFNGIDLVVGNGQVQSMRHVVVGPNGVFCLTTVQESASAKEGALRDLLFEKNVRNLEVSSVLLPTPRVVQTIQQHRVKRRLTAVEVSRIAELIEGNSRPSVLRNDVKGRSPVVWVVPLGVFSLVVAWIVMGGRVGVL